MKKETRGEKQPSFASFPSLFLLSLYNNLQVIYTLEPLAPCLKNARLDLALNNMLINT